MRGTVVTNVESKDFWPQKKGMHSITVWTKLTVVTRAHDQYTQKKSDAANAVLFEIAGATGLVCRYRSIYRGI